MNDLAHTPEQQELTHTTGRGVTLTKLLGIMAISVTSLAVAFIAWWLFFWPKPVVIYEVKILTPQVMARAMPLSSREGVVRMWVHMESPLDPGCLIGTQYFIKFEDGTLAKVPGIRITTEGAVKDATYEAAIPSGAPKGDAYLFIREAFTCGLRTQVVETPQVKFQIVEH